jgi:hypothetical protein
MYFDFELMQCGQIMVNFQIILVVNYLEPI